MTTAADAVSSPAGPPEIDGSLPYRLDERVAIRPEPFGALAYHYGNRRLVFLRAPELVEVVRTLDAHPTADAAIAAAGVTPERRPAFRRALRSLDAAEVIHAR